MASPGSRPCERRWGATVFGDSKAISELLSVIAGGIIGRPDLDVVRLQWPERDVSRDGYQRTDG
jgi:hypothetical protein